MKLSMILITVPNRSLARSLAKTLLKKNLAACCQITSAIESLYVWKQKTERNREYILMVKTRKALFSRIAQEIKKLHPYEVPEIIEIPLTHVFEPYLKWALSCCR